MSANRFTQDQILCGLGIFWREELECEPPFDPDMRIDEQLEDEDIFRLEQFFGFNCPRGEWEDFFGTLVRDPDEWEKNVAPRLTFRGLADFIRQRVEPITLEPLELLGSPCLTAGIFRGIEQLVCQIRPRARRFAPSTPIRARLGRGQRHVLWARLRWITEERIPEPPIITIHSRHLNRSCLLKLVIGILIAVWQSGLAGLLIGLILGLITTYLLVILLAVIVGVINLQINPLPEGIDTFGDLARYLAVITVDQQPECA